MLSTRKPTPFDLYGATKSAWVYCWRCSQAITLEEQATTARFHPENGLSHAECPKAGTAPKMPPAERVSREQTYATPTTPGRRWEP